METTMIIPIQENGYTVTHRIITCGLSSTYIVYFSLALVYKVIIHVIGLVLAFLTRKVKIDPLNDSRYSAAIIYCSCVMLVLAVIVVFALSGVNVYAGVWTSFVFVEVCIFLGLTFIPKVLSAIILTSINLLSRPIPSFSMLHTENIDYPRSRPIPSVSNVTYWHIYKLRVGLRTRLRIDLDSTTLAIL